MGFLDVIFPIFFLLSLPRLKSWVLADSSIAYDQGRPPEQYPSQVPEYITQTEDKIENLSVSYNTTVLEVGQIGMFSHRSGIKCPHFQSCGKDVLDHNSDKYSCRCDEECFHYNDCCSDALLTLSGIARPTIIVTEGTNYWSCRDIPSTIRGIPKNILLIDWCPEGTSKELMKSCQGNSKNYYPYLIDIPVVSSRNSIVYANIFCAKCNQENNILKFNATLRCNFDIQESSEIKDFNYQMKDLKWISPNKYNNFSKPKECLLEIIYNGNFGRPCELNVIDKCPSKWLDHLTRELCVSYNDFLSDDFGRLFKNIDCALCNGAKKSKLTCPLNNNNGGDKIEKVINNTKYTHSKMLSTTYNSICTKNKIWDMIENSCKIFTCPTFHLINGDKCIINSTALSLIKRYKVPDSCYSTTYFINQITMFNNESIHINNTNKYFKLGEFEFTRNDLVKVCNLVDGWSPNMILLSNILICISLICLLLHIIIFILLPKRRNIPSKNLFSMTICLFVVEFLFAGFYHSQANRTECFIIGILIYYFLSVAFVWTNIMSIDVFRTFGSNTYKVKSKIIFIQYSSFAWIIPIFSTALAGFVNIYTSEKFILNPQFGTHKCWFNNKWGLVSFFTIPAGLIVLINICLYSFSVYYIYRQYKLGKIASTTRIKGENSNNSNRPIESSTQSNSKRKLSKSLSVDSATTSRNRMVLQKLEKLSDPAFAEKLKERFNRQIRAHKKLRVRLALYCKLALIMGLTWIFAFVSLHTQLVIFEYLFIIFNGLQGTFIFLAFDMKTKIFFDIKVRLGLEQESSNSRVIKNTPSMDGSSMPSKRFYAVNSYESSQKNVVAKGFKNLNDKVFSAV